VRVDHALQDDRAPSPGRVGPHEGVVRVGVADDAGEVWTRETPLGSQAGR
jgi:hypothetical protein